LRKLYKDSSSNFLQNLISSYDNHNMLIEAYLT